MKKILLCLVLCGIILAGTSCSKKNEQPQKPIENEQNATDTPSVDDAPPDEENVAEAEKPDLPETVGNKDGFISGSLSEIADKLYEGIDFTPKLSKSEITKEQSIYYFGIENMDFTEALASEAMINSIPHSVCLAKMPDGTDMDALKAEIEEKANPRKWVCVSADSVLVDYIGNTIVLIMDNFDPVGIHNNFLKLAEYAETSPEAKPEATPETKPEAKPEVKPETKPQTTPEAVPEAKPETAPEAKPETALEVKPETLPEALPESPKVESTPSVEVGEENTSDSNSVVEKPQTPQLTGTLSEIMKKVYGSLEMPKLGEKEISAEEGEYYFGAADLGFESALASEPYIGSIAHSVCLAKFPDGTDMDAVKKQISENANPRKWICVEADKVYVESIGNTVILIMDSIDPDGLRNNFLALSAK